MPRNRKVIEILEGIKDLLEELRQDAVEGNGSDDDDGQQGSDGARILFIGCTPKVLPTRLLIEAAKTATHINPANAPLAGPLAAAGAGFAVDDPLKIAVMTAKYWGPSTRRLTVSFMDGGSNALKNKILSHLNAWSQTCGISFVATGGTGQVRISRGPGGYYSYLGTDVLLIPTNRQTMNLEGFTERTPESEYRRVVRHEAGHTLGFPHEHMREELVKRIDRQKAYDYFWRTNRWDQATVNAQVLTPLSKWSIFGTPSDEDSIMCYQLPGTITKNGKPIRGGLDINATDYSFAGRIYPKAGAAAGSAPSSSADGEQESDWGEDEDVELDLQSVTRQLAAT